MSETTFNSQDRADPREAAKQAKIERAAARIAKRVVRNTERGAINLSINGRRGPTFGDIRINPTVFDEVQRKLSDHSIIVERRMGLGFSEMSYKERLMVTHVPLHLQTVVEDRIAEKTAKQVRAYDKKAERMTKFIMRNVQKDVTDMPAKTSRFSLRRPYIEPPVFETLQENLAEHGLDVTIKQAAPPSGGGTEDWLHVTPKSVGPNA